MAQIIFDKGDFFSFDEGYGICLGNDKALLIKGEGGRTERIIEKGDIPSSAVPVEGVTFTDYEVTFALRAVLVAIK